MATVDWLKGIIVGIILTAVGVSMVTANSGIQLLVNVGWIFLVGGVAVAVLSGFSAIRR